MFQRKGTVSKSSGPGLQQLHVNSYALRGVPIRYTPPFYLPDQLTLPPSWSLPALPSEDLFRYDYTKERKVLEQARIRTISLAAEAEAQAREKWEKAEEEKRRIEAAAAAERAKVATLTAELPPPLIPSPAQQHTFTKTPPTNKTDASETQQPENGDSSSGIHIKDSGKIIKPLVEMSFSEFESDNFNPFDAVSLHAINDMEILQTISLAPPPQGDSPPRPSGTTTAAESERDLAGHSGVPLSSYVAPVSGTPISVGGVLPQGPIQFPGLPLPPIGGPASQPSFAPSASSVLGTSPGQTQISTSPSSNVPLQVSPLPHPSLPTLPVLPPIGTNLTSSHSYPTYTSTPSSSNQQPTLSSSPFPRPQGTLPQPSSSSPPKPTSTPHPPPRPQGTFTQPSSTLSSTPVTSTLPQPSLASYPSIAALSFPSPSTQFNPPTGSSPTLATSYLPASTTAAASGGIHSDSGGGGGIGTLFTIGEETPTSASPPVQQQPSQTPPVPKPRALAAAGQQVPNSAHLPYPPVPAPRSPVPAPRSNPSPVPAPRSNPSPVMTGAAPKPPPARPSVQARASSLMASLPQGQPLLSRPSLGVAVLPPIPPCSSTSPSSHSSPPSHPPSSSPPCPPPYQQQSSPTGDGGNSSGSPPPPYYPSPHGANDNRRFSQPVPLPSQQRTPSHFTLPDPQLSLSPEQRSQVDSMAGMGFLAPRVARAVRRFSGNHTQVVDFLILVGGLEESCGSRGDSAEVALAVCDNNEEKAKRYLQKVSYYRESGFSEKSIHGAYEKAGKDWDRALDILTQDTS